MFKLTDQLPESVVIDGEEIPVDMSFDNILRLYEMLGDRELYDYTQIVTGFKMLFGFLPKLEPQPLLELWEQLFKQLIEPTSDVGVTYDLNGNPMPVATDSDGKNYDLIQDAQYIYASFRQCYGINLFKEHGRMHWYEFKALLHGLSTDTIFKSVLNIRDAELPKDPKAREELLKLKRQYALKEADNDA